MIKKTFKNINLKFLKKHNTTNIILKHHPNSGCLKTHGLNKQFAYTLNRYFMKMAGAQVLC